MGVSASSGSGITSATSLERELQALALGQRERKKEKEEREAQAASNGSTAGGSGAGGSGGEEGGGSGQLAMLWRKIAPLVAEGGLLADVLPRSVQQPSSGCCGIRALVHKHRYAYTLPLGRCTYFIPMLPLLTSSQRADLMGMCACRGSRSVDVLVFSLCGCAPAQ